MIARAVPFHEPKPKRVTRPIEQDRRTVPIAKCVLADLQGAADHRDISVPELVRRLIGAIAEDGLVDAVLDDQESAPSRPEV